MKCSYANILKNPWDREHFTKGRKSIEFLLNFFLEGHYAILFPCFLNYLRYYCNDDSVGMKGPPRPSVA